MRPSVLAELLKDDQQNNQERIAEKNRAGTKRRSPQKDRADSGYSSGLEVAGFLPRKIQQAEINYARKNYCYRTDSRNSHKLPRKIERKLGQPFMIHPWMCWNRKRIHVISR